MKLINKTHKSPTQAALNARRLSERANDPNRSAWGYVYDAFRPMSNETRRALNHMNSPAGKAEQEMAGLFQKWHKEDKFNSVQKDVNSNP
jgi:hypothetical protein